MKFLIYGRYFVVTCRREKQKGMSERLVDEFCTLIVCRKDVNRKGLDNAFQILGYGLQILSLS